MWMEVGMRRRLGVIAQPCQDRALYHPKDLFESPTAAVNRHEEIRLGNKEEASSKNTCILVSPDLSLTAPTAPTAPTALASIYRNIPSDLARIY